MNLVKELEKLRDFHRDESEEYLRELRSKSWPDSGASNLRSRQYAHEHFVKVLENTIEKLK